MLKIGNEVRNVKHEGENEIEGWANRITREENVSVLGFKHYLN